MSQVSSITDLEIFLFLKNLPMGVICVLTAESNSMWPLIDVDDQIMLKKTSSSDIKINDIITFYSKKRKRNVVHRVIKKTYINKKILFKTKGDSNLEADKELANEKEFIGKVVSVKNKRIYLDKTNYSLLKYKMPFPLKELLFKFLTINIKT